MKVLICGAGEITRELLKRLGETWDITVIDNQEEAIFQLSFLHPYVNQAIQADPSSPVVLNEAGLSDQDYVLALTDSDRVNLAVAEFAAQAGCKYTMAQVHDSRNEDDFLKLDVMTVSPNTMAARSVSQFLEDPRIRSSPLTQGQGEILEIEVEDHSWLKGRTKSSLDDADWWLTAILRQGELLFPAPGTTFETGDRLVIAARPEKFSQISQCLAAGRLEFPLAYGRQLICAIPGRWAPDQEWTVQESLFLVRNTQVRSMTLFCSEDYPLEGQMADLAQQFDIIQESSESDIWELIYDKCYDGDIGLVVIEPLESHFLKSLIKPKLITLAHSLPCPLFVSKNSMPYRQILVPFNATANAVRALEVGIELATWLDGQVAVALVQENEYLHSDKDEDWVDEMMNQIRNLAHIHKFPLREIVRQGNPVKELVSLAADFDLMIIGSTTKAAAGFFSPHVGELLANKSPCSVLIITN